ncbi:hypothetical protein TAMA11512_12610 [Selenomonas sp. TAMA-11512]|uniref:alkaline shock response membrane anchor protein AmaP n=1 Tax=Selenomonas sp. TAMA-11512 TaxID=3095337 RepID=UPI00308B1EA1|nr:hypothetical protein TAMA11512_12610 [Selenomonas sp. TAMA-11512]
MSFFNRLILFFYALAVAVLSLGVVVLALGIVPSHILQNEYQYVMSMQKELIAGAVLVFLLSVHLLACSSSGREKVHESAQGELLIIAGTTGEVGVSLQALHRLIERVATATAGVRDTKVKVIQRKTVKDGKETTTLHVLLRLVLGREAEAAGVSDILRREICEELSHTVGIDHPEITIVVEDISNAPMTKKKRVV